MNLSIVLPCFNEEENIRQTIEDVVGWMSANDIDGEIIAVDDGSTDATEEILEELLEQHSNLCIVKHAGNKGYGYAVRSGCDEATTEWIAFMDSDGQFRAEDFNELIPHAASYDYVTGRRRKRADPLIRKVNAKLFGILIYGVLGVWIRDVNCAMKMFKKTTWETVRPTVATGALINAEVFYRLSQNKIPWKQVYVNHYPRLYGQQTGANIRVILKMFADLLRLKAQARKP